MSETRLNNITNLIHNIKTLKKFKEVVEANDNQLIVATLADGELVLVPITADGMLIVETKIMELVNQLKVDTEALDLFGTGIKS